jgi:hypothetical protein
MGGFRTSYDPSTGKLVRIELWGRPEKPPQHSLETWPDAESAEKAFWARDIKWTEASVILKRAPFSTGLPPRSSGR